VIFPFRRGERMFYLWFILRGKPESVKERKKEAAIWLPLNYLPDLKIEILGELV
jgi:hypothetical protein